MLPIIVARFYLKGTKSTYSLGLTTSQASPVLHLKHSWPGLIHLQNTTGWFSLEALMACLQSMSGFFHILSPVHSVSQLLLFICHNFHSPPFRIQKDLLFLRDNKTMTTLMLERLTDGELFLYLVDGGSRYMTVQSV